MAIRGAGPRPGPYLVAFFALLVLGVLTQVSAAVGGAQFRASPDDGVAAWHPVLAADPQGAYVAVWTTGSGVFARRYDVGGAPLGDVIAVNTTPLGQQESAQPDVAMTPQGAFVVVWQGTDAAGYTNVFARRFDAAGLPVGMELRVNGGTEPYHTDPSVALDAGGGFAVAWRMLDPGLSHEVRLRGFDALGEPVTADVIVGTSEYPPTPASRTPMPDVVVDAAGTAHVAWRDVHTVYLTRVAGGAVIGRTTVEPGIIPSPAVRIALLPEGPLVAWGGEDTVHARRHGFDGQPRGDALRVSTVSVARDALTPELDYGSPLALAANETGAWAAAWVAKDGQVYARRFAEDGSPDSLEFVLDKSPAAYARHPAVSIKGDGHLVTALTLQDDGQPEFVRGQLYQAERDDTDTDPDPYAFPTRTGVDSNKLQVSDPVMITGIDDGVPIRGDHGGEYSIDGGPFTAELGTVDAGAVVRLRHVSAFMAGGSAYSGLVVGQGYARFVTVTKTPDTQPDTFFFADLTGVDRSTTQVSNAITVTGINDPASISISGGFYSVNGGAFTVGTSTVTNGASVRVRHTSSSNYSTTVHTTLTIGGVSDTFSSTTVAASDTTPNPFSFTDVGSVARSATVTSNAITVTGIGTSAPISVSGGSYSIGTGAFTSSAGTVTSGQTVRVRHVSSADFFAQTNTTLNIGGVTDTFTSWTEDRDTAVDPFAFADQADVAPGAVVVSSPITVTGVNDIVPIGVAGGEYSLDGGPFTSQSGWANPGHTVRVRHTASSAFATAVDTILQVGSTGTRDTFTSTTRAADTTPDAFAFAPQGGVARGTLVTSAPVTVTGIEAAAPISVAGGAYSIDGGAFTTAAGTVGAGQTVRLQHTSAGAYSTSVTTTATIGGVAGSFTSTTLGDTVPDPFGFVDAADVPRSALVASNAIVVAGIDAPAPISVAGGSYSVDGAAFTAAAGTVTAGSSVRVQHTSSAAFGAGTTTTLTIGGVQGAFTTTTLARDTVPDGFSLAARLGVPRQSVQVSDPVVVTGINDAASVAVTGGEYSIDNGAFTTAAGTVLAGQSVRVRHVSAPEFAARATTTLTIGGVTAAFESVTEARDVEPESFVFPTRTQVKPGTTVASAYVTIAGINDAATVSVADGHYGIDGGAFTAAPGTVREGQGIRVRHVASSALGTAVTTTLTIGGVSGTFTTITEAPDTTPHPFSFQDEYGALPLQETTSNVVTISGINSPAPVSITGGTYSVNGGAFTSAAATVRAGDTLTLRVTAAAVPMQTVSATVTVGGVSGTWSVRTLP